MTVKKIFWSQKMIGTNISIKSMNNFLKIIWIGSTEGREFSKKAKSRCAVILDGSVNLFYLMMDKIKGRKKNQRDRCFMLSLLGDFDFEFPDAKKLERTMLSCLEPHVPEKFYINTPKAKELIKNYLAQKKDYKVAECIGGIGEKKSNGGTQFYQQDRIYAGDIALAHPAGLSEGSYKYIVAQRGRGGGNNWKLTYQERPTL